MLVKKKKIVKEARSLLLVLQLVKMVGGEAEEVWSTEVWWMVPGWKLHLLECWSVQWMCLGTIWKLQNSQVSCSYSTSNNEFQFQNTPSNKAFPLQSVLQIWAGGPQVWFCQYIISIMSLWIGYINVVSNICDISYYLIKFLGKNIWESLGLGSFVQRD